MTGWADPASSWPLRIEPGAEWKTGQALITNRQGDDRQP